MQWDLTIFTLRYVAVFPRDRRISCITPGPRIFTPWITTIIDCIEEVWENLRCFSMCMRNLSDREEDSKYFSNIFFQILGTFEAILAEFCKGWKLQGGRADESVLGYSFPHLKIWMEWSTCFPAICFTYPSICQVYSTVSLICFLKKVLQENMNLNWFSPLFKTHYCIIFKKFVSILIFSAFFSQQKKLQNNQWELQKRTCIIIHTLDRKVGPFHFATQKGQNSQVRQQCVSHFRLLLSNTVQTVFVSQHKALFNLQINLT